MQQDSLDPQPDAPAADRDRSVIDIHGRTTEKAVHRKKDEIAKRLRQARDLLTRNR